MIKWMTENKDWRIEGPTNDILSIIILHLYYGAKNAYIANCITPQLLLCIFRRVQGIPILLIVSFIYSILLQPVFISLTTRQRPSKQMFVLSKQSVFFSPACRIFLVPYFRCVANYTLLLFSHKYSFRNLLNTRFPSSRRPAAWVLPRRLTLPNSTKYVAHSHASPAASLGDG